MNRRLNWFIIAVAVQALVLAAVPARQIYTRQTGTTVILKTAPRDPYDILSGYYVTLTYEIARPKSSDWRRLPKSKPVWVVLKESDDGIWNADSAHDSRPESMPDGCVVIKGRKKGSRIVYGIESYFIPENARDTVERDLRQNRGQARVEVKIDSFGHAALIRLLIEDRVYEY